MGRPGRLYDDLPRRITPAGPFWFDSGRWLGLAIRIPMLLAHEHHRSAFRTFPENRLGGVTPERAIAAILSFLADFPKMLGVGDEQIIFHSRLIS